MACDRYDEYIGDGSDRHLDQLKKDALKDITRVFGIKPFFGIPDNELRKTKHRYLNNKPHFIVPSPTSQPTPSFFEGGARLLEIDNLSWQYHGNRHLKWRRNTRGAYNYNAGVIFLHKPIYCRHTVLHEVLHATSIFSRVERPPQFKTQQSLREGITETLTGYVLDQMYPTCCDAWRNNKHVQCGISGYRPRVRIWSSISRHIGVGTIAEFYLSESDNIAEPWNQLQATVREMGFEDFSCPLDERTRFDENMFREMAFKSISGLKDTFNDYSRNLDYSPR